MSIQVPGGTLPCAFVLFALALLTPADSVVSSPDGKHDRIQNCCRIEQTRRLWPSLRVGGVTRHHWRDSQIGQEQP